MSWRHKKFGHASEEKTMIVEEHLVPKMVRREIADALPEEDSGSLPMRLTGDSCQ